MLLFDSRWLEAFLSYPFQYRASCVSWTSTTARTCDFSINAEVTNFAEENRKTRRSKTFHRVFAHLSPISNIFAFFFNYFQRNAITCALNNTAATLPKWCVKSKDATVQCTCHAWIIEALRCVTFPFFYAIIVLETPHVINVLLACLSPWGEEVIKKQTYYSHRNWWYVYLSPFIVDKESNRIGNNSMTSISIA